MCKDLHDTYLVSSFQVAINLHSAIPIILAFFLPIKKKKKYEMVLIIFFNRKKNVAQLGMKMKKGVYMKAW